VDRVLVAYGTRDGGTGEVALAIGEQFTRAGFRVDVRPCARAKGPEAYRAVVCGSAVSDDGWEPGAVDYLEAHLEEILRGPTWLYERPVTVVPPVAEPTALLRSINCAEEIASFGGPLGRWSPDEPLWRLAPSCSLPDHLQEWNRVRRWAQGLADRLAAVAAMA
jgi:menaquinone-dependent protoporphyrinogen oxidase